MQWFDTRAERAHLLLDLELVLREFEVFQKTNSVTWKSP
jgi:hypothetical protein